MRQGGSLWRLEDHEHRRTIAQWEVETRGYGIIYQRDVREIALFCFDIESQQSEWLIFVDTIGM